MLVWPLAKLLLAFVLACVAIYSYADPYENFTVSPHRARRDGAVRRAA